MCRGNSLRFRFFMFFSKKLGHRKSKIIEERKRVKVRKRAVGFWILRNLMLKLVWGFLDSAHSSEVPVGFWGQRSRNMIQLSYYLAT